MYAMARLGSGDSHSSHLRSEVSGACRGLSFVLEALLRGGLVHIYRDLRTELFLFDKFLSPFWQKLTRCPNKKKTDLARGCFPPSVFSLPQVVCATA